MDTNKLLIITSSVFVSSPFTKVIDSSIREKQYVDSILYYLNNSNIKQIIVCDNSGFDYSNYNFETIALLKHKNIEILTFKGEFEAISKFGKGFGEGEIIKYVLNNSNLIQNSTAYFKVTGRIIVKNINKIIKFTGTNQNYFNLIQTKPTLLENRVDTRLYYCQKSTYINSLYNSYKDVNDPNGYYLEHAFYAALKRDKVSYTDFKIIPDFRGVSGSTGISYNEPFLKLIIKQFLKKFK